MTRYEPVMNQYGQWVAFDREANAQDHTPVYRDRKAAQSWCDIRNAIQDGEPTEEMHRLYARHEEILNG